LVTIIGKISFKPKNAYLRVLGRSFNSREEDEGTLGRPYEMEREGKRRMQE